ncbi:YceD family protein [Achromobacter sp. NPDC058515]|uniref:YceD family protein n=1 Tax=Achromobacter sp. NPDC058515 TaxID=3346533 RepID=UPI003654C588
MAADAKVNVKADAQVDPTRIDAYAYARLGKQAQGTIALLRLARVVEGLPEQPLGEAGLVTWSVRGEEGKTGLLLGQPLLHLRVQANPVVVCQRCNVPFAYPVDSEVLLQLVKSEDDLDDGSSVAEQGDGYDDEDDEGEGRNSAPHLPEKVVGSHRFDLLAQVEDELILSIPYVPKHDVCPGAQAKVSEAPEEGPAVKRPSPFAVLEQLKHKD